MNLVFHRSFEKRLKKASPDLYLRIIETISLFQKNPKSPILRNHALKGIMKGKRSITVNGDTRIIFEVQGDYIMVILLDVGSHSQVYR